MSWYFDGGIPPHEFGDLDSGNWFFKGKTLIFEDLKSGLPEEIFASWMEFSAAIIVDDQLLLRQNGHEMIFQPYLGHLDAYIAELNEE